MIDTSKLTPEWLAGFFDGEGCVSFNTDRMSLKVNLTQADFELLRAIAEKYHAKGPYEKFGKRSKKPVYEINWTARRAVEILPIIRPYVVRKAPQVELGIRFLELYTDSHSCFPNKPLPLENKLERGEICDRLRALNSGTIRSDARQEEYTN